MKKNLIAIIMAMLMIFSFVATGCGDTATGNSNEGSSDLGLTDDEDNSDDAGGVQFITQSPLIPMVAVK